MDDLLNYVYFETAPMRLAVRGEKLDLTAAASEAPRVTGYAPLPPPEVSEDLRRRVAEWRRGLGPPKATVTVSDAGAADHALMTVGEMDDLVDAGTVLARGRLRLAPEVEVSD